MEPLAIVLLLAQMCVAEIGFREDVSECKLMWQVNQTNADRHGRTLEEQTKLFNAIWRSREQREQRPWILNLKQDGTKPARWGKRKKWFLPRHRDRWLNYIAAAKQFIRTEQYSKHPCPGAIDYGAPYDKPKDPRLVQMACLGGKTYQRYWRVR